MTQHILYFLLGSVTGGVGGLIGIGGAVILIPFLRLFVGIPAATSTGIAIIGSFTTSLSGSFKYYKFGNIYLIELLPIIIAGAISSSIFSIVFPACMKNLNIFDPALGLILLMSASKMLHSVFTKKKDASEESNKERNNIFLKFSIGLIAGIFPAIFGIGAGVLLVPTFNFILRMDIKKAMGSSLVCFCLNALISAIFKYYQGYVDLSIAIPIALGALIGAYTGANLNKKFKSTWLRFIFGLYLCYVAVRFILPSVI